MSDRIHNRSRARQASGNQTNPQATGAARLDVALVRSVWVEPDRRRMVVGAPLRES